MKPVTIESVVEIWKDPKSRPLFKRLLIDDNGSGGVCYCAQGHVLHLSGWSDENLDDAEQREADVVVARTLGISVAHSVLLRYVNDKVDGCPQDVLERPENIIGDQSRLVLEFWRRLDDLTAIEWKDALATDSATKKAALNAALNADGGAAWNAALKAAKKAASKAAWGDALNAALNAALKAAWNDGLKDVDGTAWNAALRAAEGAAEGAAEIAAWNDAWNAAWGAVSESAWGDVWTFASGASWATNEIQGAATMRKRGQPFFFLPLFGINDPSELDGDIRKGCRT